MKDFVDRGALAVGSGVVAGWVLQGVVSRFLPACSSPAGRDRSARCLAGVGEFLPRPLVVFGLLAPVSGTLV
jgi:hypothetical protein